MAISSSRFLPPILEFSNVSVMISEIFIKEKRTDDFTEQILHLDAFPAGIWGRKLIGKNERQKELVRGEQLRRGSGG